MIKKAIVTAAVLGIGAVALLGTDVCSYGRTMFGNVREAVRSEIDPEFELDRIRGKVEDLMPEVRQHMKVVAEQVVDVRNMQAGIEEKQGQMQNQKASLLALRSDLDSGQNEFEYRQVSYTRNEVESDLADRFSAYRLLEASLDRDVRILKATKATLKANQKNLDSMLSRKQELAVTVSELEARLKQIQATETVNAMQVDDTQLSDVEDLLQRLNRDLDVRETMLETEGHVLEHIPIEESNVPETDLISEIDEHFGLTTETESVAELASVSGI